jgi:hypothetical protein
MIVPVLSIPNIPGELPRRFVCRRADAAQSLINPVAVSWTASFMKGMSDVV